MTHCSTCNGSGFVPFVKGSKVIPNVKLFCPECHEENDYLPPLQPSDFGFPMSYSVYRSLCQEHGWADPGSDYPKGTPPQTQVVEHIYRTSRMSSQEFKELEHISGAIKYLLSKEKPIKTQTKKPIGYKGLK